MGDAGLFSAAARGVGFRGKRKRGGGTAVACDGQACHVRTASKRKKREEGKSPQRPPPVNSRRQREDRGREEKKKKERRDPAAADAIVSVEKPHAQQTKKRKNERASGTGRTEGREGNASRDHYDRSKPMGGKKKGKERLSTTQLRIIKIDRLGPA